MSDSNQLQGLKPTLSDLSDEDLRALMISLRSNRRTVKAKAVELSVKGQKDGSNTKTTIKQTIKGLSAEQVQQLLLQLEQGATP